MDARNDVRTVEELSALEIYDDGAMESAALLNCEKVEAGGKP